MMKFECFGVVIIVYDSFSSIDDILYLKILLRSISIHPLGLNIHIEISVSKPDNFILYQI